MSDLRNAQMIFNQALSLYENKIKSAQANAVDEIKTVVLDLSVARSRQDPMRISFPFKNVRVEEASDANCFIRLIPESNDSHVSDTLLGLRDDFGGEFGFSKCFLFWDSQPNKKMILKFFTTSKVQNGQTILNNTNNPPIARMGYAEAYLDGMTFMLENSQDIPIEVASAGGHQVVDFNAINDSSFDNGNYNIVDWEMPPPYSHRRKFLVPKGYQAHLLSAEYQLKTGDEIPFQQNSADQFFLMGIPNEGSFATEEDLWNLNFDNRRGILRLPINAVVGTYPLHIYSKYYFPEGKNVIDENNIIGLALTNSNNAGKWLKFTLRLLVRLTRKVGA